MSAVELQLETDVLVIGGGLAGTWAAVGAARAGASVILADKGYCGTSGVTASAGPGHWWVPPDARAEAIAGRLEVAGGLADPEWMARILDLTWRSLPGISHLYRFPVDETGAVQYRSLRGPEYLKAMRALVQSLGVAILDQSPALELLRHADGSVAGARGHRRQKGEDWTVRAGAVVVATGGCAFLSDLLGSHTNTGDGLLMGAEAGAELSGMELSNYYTIAAAGSSMTRSMSYTFGRYYDSTGRELPVPIGPGMSEALGRALLEGPVFCRLDLTPADIQARMPTVQPNFMLPFDRWGVNPYRDAFEITLHAEGTVRGVGGLRIADEQCQTSVPGLFAAGDAASRELVAGAVSGGGAINSSWALSSGQWAGKGAARRALSRGRRASTSAEAAGEAGLRPKGRPIADAAEIVAAVQAETLPLDKTMFRTGPGLGVSQARLETAWQDARDGLAGAGRAKVRAREAAAMAATARWCVHAALERAETRGMHNRSDLPAADPRLARRLTIGGLDRLWTQWERTAAPALAAS